MPHKPFELPASMRVDPSMQIRNACTPDFTTILQLNKESVHYLSPLDKERLEKLHHQSAYHKVIEIDGLVWAFLLAFREGADYDSPNYQWFSRRYESFLYIDRAVIHKNLRRKGYGSILYEDLIRFACGLGIKVLTCEIDISPPNPGSLFFHEAYGFREVGTQWLNKGKKQVSLRKIELPGSIGQGHARESLIKITYPEGINE